MKPAFLILGTLAAICAAAIAWGAVWDNNIKPRTTIPELPSKQRYSHALPGINRLIEQARLRDPSIDPRYVIHMSKADTREFEAPILYLGARLGWLTHRGNFDREILATVPEADIPEIERMTQEPGVWLSEAMEREPAQTVRAGPVINVGIDLGGYHGRSLKPFIPIGTGIAGLAALLIAGIIIIANEADRRNPVTNRDPRSR